MQLSRKKRFPYVILGVIAVALLALVFVLGANTPELQRTHQEIPLPEGRF